MKVELQTESSFQAAYQERLFLYATTTRTDLDVSVRDRAELEWDGKGGWALEWEGEDWVAAPSLPDCRDVLDYEGYYPYALHFELGDADGQPIDDNLYPPITFETTLDEEGFWSRELWSGLRLRGRLEPFSTDAPNTPVDTATW